MPGIVPFPSLVSDCKTQANWKGIHSTPSRGGSQCLHRLPVSEHSVKATEKGYLKSAQGKYLKSHLMGGKKHIS